MTDHTDGIVVGGCRLGEIIGRGGMGTVYRAVQLGVERPVAVKLMPVTGGDDAAVGRFQREAHLAGTLDHPHCLPLYAAGEADGLLYLVTRLVEGGDLARRVEDGGPLSPARAKPIIEQVAGAVDFAHRAGLVHRDLKPANILIETRVGRDHAYVSDFGLMRGVVDDREITLAGQWLGTPEFAAPEQKRGEAVGPAADIYALGAVLRFMLGPDISPAARAVVTKAMSPDPADRYATANEFGAAAGRALAGARPAPKRPRRAVPAAIATVLLGLIAAAIVVIVTRPSDGHQVPGADRTATATGTTAARETGVQLTVPHAFTATLPAGWVVLAPVVRQEQGYLRTIARSSDGSVTANIDRTPDFTGSMDAHLAMVQAEIKQTTANYHSISTTHITIDSSPATIWKFTVPDDATGQRVDVYRVVGGSLYAVLVVSNAMSDSEAAAMTIAGSITSR